MDGPISTDMIHTSSKQSWEQNLNNNKIFFLVYFATNRELFFDRQICRYTYMLFKSIMRIKTFVSFNIFF